MLLREFDLDLPEENKDLRHQFRNDVRCIAAQYFSFFPKKFKTNGFWKVLVECSSEEGLPHIYMKVMTVKVVFDFERYLLLDKIEKKKSILHALNIGLLKVSQGQGWDPLLLEDCFRNVVASAYDFHWVFKKTKKNPARKLVAQITCHHDLDEFTAKLCVSDLSGSLVFECLLVDEDPNEFAFAYKLGDFKWLSNQDIAFYNKQNDLVAKIDINAKMTMFLQS
ncbi:hypothetical protein G3R49_02095 [Shewanella sp. WXL01]|uniref:hypothetical protein n=1 Tax=Shewanella sp. WXL01 TaxID=2709721 RepID=UPI0014386300|nr:hypothetical protein [Shewanella sp. WXL01]NKF49372.1 hypothetical protein [Shewanella sp. WXL01]